jgi:hypothetical protein
MESGDVERWCRDQRKHKYVLGKHRHVAGGRQSCAHLPIGRGALSFTSANQWIGPDGSPAVLGSRAAAWRSPSQHTRTHGGNPQ